MYGIGGAERLPHGLPSRKINRIYIDLAMSRSKIKMSEHTTCFLLEHYSLVAPLRVCHGWSRSSPPAASPRRPSTRPSTTPTSRGEARAQAEAQGRGGGNRLNALETQLAARCTCCNRVCKRGDRRVLKTYRTGASTKPLAPLSSFLGPAFTFLCTQLLLLLTPKRQTIGIRDQQATRHARPPGKNAACPMAQRLYQ